VTLKDVAQASGVSIATASFVLNRAAGQTIPPATQDRVRQAAAELGYVPHGAARALREGASRLVLLNAAGLPPGGSLQSFIEGLEDELDQHGHALLVRHGSARPGTLRRVVEATAPRTVIDLESLYAGDGTDVNDGGWIDGLAAHTAVQIRHLAARGHRRLALALPDPPPLPGTPPPAPPGTPPGTPPSAPPGTPRLARLAALREAHTRQIAEVLGLPAPAVIHLGTDLAANQQALLANPGVTAIAAFHDDTALRVLATMATLGRSAPADIAVIGFDETEHGALWTPALTTVHIDAAAYGRRAARRALGQAAGDAPIESARVVIRESA
jgi:DNA-binding LacI/PurR family transcriptional regulator